MEKSTNFTRAYLQEKTPPGMDGVFVWSIDGPTARFSAIDR
jgi:hypothetical protein